MEQIGADFRHAVALANGYVFAVPTLDEGNGHGFAAHDEIAQVRELSRFELRRVGHHFEHGRHGHEERKLFVLKHLQHR